MHPGTVRLRVRRFLARGTRVPGRRRNNERREAVDRKGAFVGLGVMAGHLAKNGCGVCNRTAAKADSWTREYGVNARPAEAGADFGQRLWEGGGKKGCSGPQDAAEYRRQTSTSCQSRSSVCPFRGSPKGRRGVPVLRGSRRGRTRTRGFRGVRRRRAAQAAPRSGDARQVRRGTRTTVPGCRSGVLKPENMQGIDFQRLPS